MKITPLKDNVLGRMIEVIGNDQITVGGLIVVDNQNSEVFVRPRWFEVTHIGPEQTDVYVGQYVLVEQGRWSRGLDPYGTHQEKDKIFLLDKEGILGISETFPVNDQGVMNENS